LLNILIQFRRFASFPELKRSKTKIISGSAAQWRGRKLPPAGLIGAGLNSALAAARGLVVYAAG
jgi:hypothetical protein